MDLDLTNVENHQTENREDTDDQLELIAASKAVNYDRPRRLLDFGVEGRLARPYSQPRSKHSALSVSSDEDPTTSQSRKISISSEHPSDTAQTSPSEYSDADTTLSSHLDESLKLIQNVQQCRQNAPRQRSTENSLNALSTDSEPVKSVTQALKSISPCKKKHKKSTKNGLKNAGKRRKSNDTQEKPVAQLELPDPVPLPKTGKIEHGWNQVLSKQAAKRSSKLEVAAHKGREVNASPCLARRLYDDEEELPAARTARFGLRGAKHDIKSTVPREVFEFESFY